MSADQTRANFEAMHVEFLAREIMLQMSPYSPLTRASGALESARALFNLGWRPPGYCECGVPAVESQERSTR